MTDKRKYTTPEDLVAHLKDMAHARAGGVSAHASVVNGVRQSPQRLTQLANCEDFFSKMDILLPTHEASRKVAFMLLARLCAGKPNLPGELV